MQAFDRNAIGSLHEAMESIAIDSCTFRSPETVLILGESYNKHHAALYGYPLPTTPRLSQEEAAGRLYPFTDVVSPANFTVKPCICSSPSPARTGKRRGATHRYSPLSSGVRVTIR